MVRIHAPQQMSQEIASRRVKGKDWWVGITSKALIFWAEHLIRKDIKGKENLLEAADHVNKDIGGLIVTPNHNSFVDIILMNQVRNEINPRKSFRVLWANKFTGKDKGKYSETGQEDLRKVLAAGKIGKEIAKMVNIELVDVPQEAKDFGSARNIINQMRSIGEETLGNKNVLGVFPEGTRSRNGMLGEAKRALKVLFNNPAITDKTLILPIAATGTGEYLPPDSEKPNLLAKVSIIYGKPYTYVQAKEEMEMFKVSLETIIMWHIGQLLPEEKWGIYKDTFSRIKAVK